MEGAVPNENIGPQKRVRSEQYSLCYYADERIDCLGVFEQVE